MADVLRWLERAKELDGPDLLNVVDYVEGFWSFDHPDEDDWPEPPEPNRHPGGHLECWVSGFADQLWLPLNGMWRPLPPDIPTVRDVEAPTDVRSAEGTSTPVDPIHATRTALAGILGAASERDRSACLIIDAADTLAEAIGTADAATLAALLGAQPRLGVVLLARTASGLGPLLKVADVVCDLRAPVRPTALRRFLLAGFASGGITCTEEGIDALLGAAGGPLFAVQRLAHLCWELCRAGRDVPATLTPDCVEAATSELASRLDSVYERQWRELAAGQQAALLAVLTHNGRGLASQAVFEAAGMGNATSMQRAIDALLDRELVWREPSSGPKSPGRVRFVDSAFAHWLQLAGHHVADQAEVSAA